MLAHVLARLKQCRMIDRIVVATAEKDENRAILDLARREGVDGFAGSEDDVLDRYYQAADRYRPENVVRCTGDCPVLDPQVVDRVIGAHLEGKYDYTSNTLRRTYPRGYDTEVMTFKALKKSAEEAQEPREREHVTPYIWEHPSMFKLGEVLADPGQTQPDLRVTVDTAEDFKFLEEIFKALYDQDPFFSVGAVMELMRQRPELRLMNAHVQQKKT